MRIACRGWELCAALKHRDASQVLLKSRDSAIEAVLQHQAPHCCTAALKACCLRGTCLHSHCIHC